ncbi:MAG: Gfo/Idh/MocA family oxidoreductase, partial [Candidatus Omnitrophica bacterium]|nr:Gfo/Idh/MocA family oxidoreductase [Candidatus Omnitrophota bacterium]
MVRVGIIGAGFMGNMHATVYSQFPDVKVAGIADIRGEKAKSLAEKIKSIPYYSPEELMKKEDITIIDICLPTFLHKQYVIMAASYGKDVICEKPIALTIEEADEMINVCQEKRVRFMVAQVLRFWPEYRFLKEVYDRKKYGSLRTISCQRLSATPNWGWQNWLQDSERSGSALIDLHIHDTDFLLYLTGQKPEKLTSYGKLEEGGYTHIYTTFSFPQGIIGQVEGGWDLPANYPFLMAFTAIFERAVIEFNSRNKPTLVVYEANGRIERPEFAPKQVAGVEGNISDLGGYYYELRYFIEHVIHNKPFGVITPEQARDSLAV